MKKALLVGYMVFAFILVAPGPLLVKSLVLIPAAILALLNNYQQEKASFLMNRLNEFKGLLILFSITLIGSIIANNYQLLIRQLPLLILPFAIPFFSKNEKNGINRAMLLGLLSYYFWVIGFDIYYLASRQNLQPITLDYLRYINSSTLPGVIDWNYLGMYILVVMILVFSQDRLRKIDFVFIAFSILIAPFTLGKISILLLLVVLAYFIVKQSYQDYRRPATIVLVILCFITITLSVVFKDALIVSANSRLQIWREALELISAKPIFGYGPDNVKDVFNQHLEQKEMTIAGVDSNHIDAHNIFLQAMLNFGVFGLAALMYFFISSKRKLDTSLNLILALILLVGLFEHIFQRQWGIMFIAFIVPYLTIKNHGSR